MFQWERHKLLKCFISCGINSKIKKMNVTQSLFCFLCSLYQKNEKKRTILTSFFSMYIFTLFFIVKIPQIASGHSGDIDGYSFEDDWSKKCSYMQILDYLGKLNERGTKDLSKESFFRDNFFLPFKVHTKN